MNNKEEKKSIRKEILSKIKKGEIKMRPRMYFVLKTILVILGIFLVGLFLFFLVSFIMFSLHSTGVWYLPRFGFRALGPFFGSLPWLLILTGLILVAVLEVLVRRFSFSYRRPVLYSILGIIIIVALGSSIVSRAHIHSVLFNQAREGRLPVTGELYRNFGMRKFRDVHHGIISEKTEEGFIIETPRKEKLKVIITTDTGFLTKTDIRENDIVVVLGKRDDDTVRAVDIRRVEDDLRLFQGPHMPRPLRSPVW